MKPRNTLRALTTVATLGLAAFVALSSCDSSTNGGGNGGPVGDVTPITVGVQGQAVQINQGNVLKFSFVAKPGGVYQITTAGNTDVYLTLFDSTGTKVIQLDQASSSTNGLISYTNNGTTSAKLIVSVQGNSTNIAGGTVLSVVMTSGPDEYEPDNGISQATTIPTDSTIQAHTLTASDHDWFKFSATEGTAYSIETIGSLDTYIKLFSSDSVELAERDDGGVSSGSSKMIWMCPKSGTYAVDVRGYSTSTTGSYSLAVKAQPASRYPDRGESNNVPSKAFRLAIDSTYNLFFFSGDTDCYAIPATSGQPLKISLTSSASFGGVTLSTPDGTVLSSSVTTSGYTFTPTVTGNYLLRFVPPSFGSTNGTYGAYSLTLTTTTPQDLSHAATIPTDSTQLTRTMAAGDNNWFKFTADSGAIYAMETSGSLDTYIKLFNSDSLELVERDDGGTYSGASKLIWLAPKSGTYFVDIRGYSTSTAGTYGLAIKTQPAARYPDRGENNNSAAKAFVVAMDTSYSLFFFSGDTDYYAIPATAGQPVRIALSYSSSSYGSAYLYSPDGTVLSSSVNTAGYTFTPAATGNYLLRFAPASFGSSNGTYGAYSMTVSALPPQDLAHATVIPTDSTQVTRVLAAGDNFWFKFTADSGAIYAMETSGSIDTYLKLFTSDSMELAERDGNGSSSSPARMVWLCPKAGTYYVDAKGFPSGSSTVTGSFGFAIKSQPASRYPDRGEFNNKSGTAFPVSLDSTYNLYFFSGDTDYYSFPAKAGSSYRIQSTYGTASYSTVSLYSPDGPLLSSSASGSYTFNATQTGNYLIRFAPSSFGSGNGANGSYTLAVSEVLPQNLANAATISTDSTVVSRSLTGTSSTPDYHYFKFTADSGRVYSIQTLPSGSTDTYLWLMNPDSSIITERDDGGNSSSRGQTVAWLCNHSGGYYVGVKGYSGSTGTYSISVKAHANSDFPDPSEPNSTMAQAFPLTLGTAASLYFTSGDTDYVSFPAVSGTRYTVSYSVASSSSSSLPCQAYLYTTSGALWGTISSGSYYTPSADGTIVIRFVSNSSSGVFAPYTVRVQ